MSRPTMLAMSAHRAITVTIVAALICAVILAPLAAFAAKTSVVTKLDGSAAEVRASDDGEWLALWVTSPSGSAELIVIESRSGSQQYVTESKYPGGICWIPDYSQLLYCVGSPIEGNGAMRVIYYVYDPEEQDTTKITNVIDLMPDVDENTSGDIAPDEINVTSPGTYTLNPIASYDGSVVFHMTRDFIAPSFNLYSPDRGVMATNPVSENIGPDYDLSNDGTMLYWPLSDGNGNVYIVGYNLERMEETWHVMFEAAKLPCPADGGMLIKVDSANERAAMLAWNEAQPRLNLYVFGWNEPGDIKVRPYPLYLEAGEEILDYDWYGITGKIYAVVYDNNTGTTALELIDPIFGVREQLTWGTDAFSFVDYAKSTKTFFYCVVDNSGRSPRTAVVRVEE